MFKSLLSLPKAFFDLLLIRALFLFTLFTGLLLLTLFMAYIIMLDWHCSAAFAALVCLAPWGVAILVLGLLFCHYRCRFNRKKHAAMSFPDHLLLQVITLMVSYFSSKKE